MQELVRGHRPVSGPLRLRARRCLPRRWPFGSRPYLGHSGRPRCRAAREDGFEGRMGVSVDPGVSHFTVLDHSGVARGLDCTLNAELSADSVSALVGNNGLGFLFIGDPIYCYLTEA